MTFDTGGYGGQTIRERVRIMTNDADLPWLEVAIAGQVEKFADIRPARVRLAGPADQPLVAEVEIVPRADFPFTIQRIVAEREGYVKFDWTRRDADGQSRYVIRVENQYRYKGRYIETLTVETDSAIRPRLAIHVVGVIQ